LLINGFPLVLVETKTPARPSASWVDGAIQIHADYERSVPELFACHVFSVATDGKDLRYGAVHMPVDLWGPWRLDNESAPKGLSDLHRAVCGLLAPATVLDILASFTLFATDNKQRHVKLVCRYRQYEGAIWMSRSARPFMPRTSPIW
jgi:type I restriction enzyme, R subunit